MTEEPQAPSAPVEEVIGQEMPEDDGATGIPLGCLWNMEGIYAVAEAYSPAVAALRYMVHDDGRTLAIHAIQADAGCASMPTPPRRVANGRPDECAASARMEDVLLFRRSAEGFLEVVEGGGDAVPPSASSAGPGADIGRGGLSSIADCGRTHLTIQTAVISTRGKAKAQEAKASGRTSPDLDPSESDGMGNAAERPAPEVTYRTIRLTRAR